MEKYINEAKQYGFHKHFLIPTGKKYTKLALGIRGELARLSGGDKSGFKRLQRCDYRVDFRACQVNNMEK